MSSEVKNRPVRRWLIDSLREFWVGLRHEESVPKNEQPVRVDLVDMILALGLVGSGLIWVSTTWAGG